MLPRRPAALGSCSSMWAPISRQRVKTVVRFTWRIYRCGSALEMGGQSVHPHLVPVMARKSMTRMSFLNASTIQQDINPIAVMYDRRYKSRHAFFRREIGLVDAGFPVELFNRSLGFRVCGITLQECKKEVRCGISLGYCSLGPGEYLRPLQPKLAPWLVRSLGCHQ